MDLELALLFGLWYIGNIGYNEWNKLAATASGDKTKYAMTISTLQLAVGVVLAVFLWLTRIRKFPKLKTEDWIKHIPVGICSAGAHSASVFSLAAGGVAFGQIVKAAEPVFAALVGVVFYQKAYSGAKWISLVPIIGGVVLASLKLADKNAGFSPDNVVLDFSVGGLVGALVANLFAAFKGNESHKLMEDGDLKKRIDGAANQFAITTIVALLASIPVMIYMEMGVFEEFMQKLTNLNISAWPTSVQGYTTPVSNPLMTNLILSGVSFYMYNEWATLSLKKVDPATQSVANTAKRVFVIAFGVMTNPEADFGILKQIGCATCLLGVYINSNIDNWVAPKEKTN